jgi:hypothetical protein
MNTHNQPPAVPPLASPQKRAYHTPQVIDLGDVRELTRGGGGPYFDGPGRPTRAGG